MAAHIVGAYDFGTKRVIDQLVPFNIKQKALYTAQTYKLLENTKTLHTNIDQLTAKMTEAERIKQELQKAVEESEQRSGTSGTSDALARVSKLPTELEKMMDAQKVILGHWKPATIGNAKDIREMLSSMLDIEVRDDFFALGNLKINTTFSALGGTQFDGTDDEKAKYDKIHELSYTLGRVGLADKSIC
jgi:DNA repair exonuclease SbcCD ATPase subunit